METEAKDNYQGTFITEIITTTFGGPVSTFGNGTIRFSLETGSIDEFEADGSFSIYSSTYAECERESIGSFRGTVKNELQLEIIGEGCLSGKFEMQLVRSRPRV